MQVLIRSLQEKCCRAMEAHGIDVVQAAILSENYGVLAYVADRTASAFKFTSKYCPDWCLDLWYFDRERVYDIIVK